MDDKAKKKAISIAKKVAVVILIPIILAFLAAIGLGIWYFFIRVTPETVYEDTVAAARARDADTFREQFTSESVRALEGSWTSDTIGRAGSWNRMMEDILEPTGAPPELIEVEENEEGDAAKVRIRLRKKRRNIYLVNTEEEGWKIDVLSGINVGISEVARKAKKETVETDPDKAKKDKEFQEAPKKEGWWKGKGGEEKKEE